MCNTRKSVASAAGGTWVLTLIFIVSSSLPESAVSSVNDNSRILSRASDAFEINSLKKIWREILNSSQAYAQEASVPMLYYNGHTYYLFILVK